MDRKLLHLKLKKLADEGGYDFLCIDDFDAQGNFIPDSSIPVCDRVPVADAIPGDPRWAWVTTDTMILFASSDDEQVAEKFVSQIKKAKG